METAKTKSKAKTATIVALALIATGAISTTAYIHDQQSALEQAVRSALADKDKALAEQEAALARLNMTSDMLSAIEQKNSEAMNSIADLEDRLAKAEARASELAGIGVRNEKQAKELADLKLTAQQLRDKLKDAQANEVDLRTAADRANAEREALAHQLEMRDAGARMVNNAQVDALKGKKAKLTVKARRANELHMAFDLPEALASGANFTITSPKGTEYTGQDPSVSTSRAMNEATASAHTAGKPSKAASTARVDLKFNPKKKLEPGVYRIDVSSGKDYLQTFYLKLR
ncbi:MAG: hypothetical protein KA408_03995 [Flavobacteriales bacterium]|nr:hypothetical protein [Flavobacteriales bacterium]